MHRAISSILSLTLQVFTNGQDMTLEYLEKRPQWNDPVKQVRPKPTTRYVMTFTLFSTNATASLFFSAVNWSLAFIFVSLDSWFCLCWCSFVLRMFSKASMCSLYAEHCRQLASFKFPSENPAICHLRNCDLIFQSFVSAVHAFVGFGKSWIRWKNAQTAAKTA